MCARGGGIHRSPAIVRQCSSPSASHLARDFSSGSNPVPAVVATGGSNAPASASTPAFPGDPTGTNAVNAKLAMAVYLVNTREPEKAESLLISLLAANMPDSVQRTAMLQLGIAVQEESDF